MRSAQFVGVVVRRVKQVSFQLVEREGFPFQEKEDEFVDCYFRSVHAAY